ncbi:MAG: ABC transporter substrate-binding protein, partial [Cutibacterium avidum]|nr:ABC transporter substrate-binding protein [Cutibacterium avidum]
VGIKCEIKGRPKNFYSIYKKMKKKGKVFDEIYDLSAVRILTNSVKDCYGALGVVHTLFKPIPGRFKDYIAMPKPNKYQSLHTTVIDNNGETFEVQIRTYEMHQTAEYGIAAHWKYKAGVSKETAFDENLTWLRQLLEWQKDLNDPGDFMDTLKIDFFADEVFVFTPNGDVINLPEGSTPIDFAYRIHSQVGNTCVGAKVNGRIVPLNYTLQSGNIVEVITNPNTSPSLDWLNIVKSPQARKKISQYFKVKDKEKNIERPKDMEGHNYATWGLEIEQAILKQVVEDDGGDFSKVEMIPENVTNAVQAINGDIDTVWIFYQVDGVLAKNQNVPINYFAFKDISPVFDYYTPILIANNDFLKDKEDVAKRFMKAFVKGYEYAIENPDEAAEILVKANPELDKDLVKGGMEYLKDKYKDDAEYFGQIDSKRWNDFYTWLFENGLIENEIPKDFG